MPAEKFHKLNLTDRSTKNRWTGRNDRKFKGTCSCGEWETDWLSTGEVFDGWDHHRSVEEAGA